MINQFIQTQIVACTDQRRIIFRFSNIDSRSSRWCKKAEITRPPRCLHQRPIRRGAVSYLVSLRGGKQCLPFELAGELDRPLNAHVMMKTTSASTISTIRHQLCRKRIWDCTSCCITWSCFIVFSEVSCAQTCPCVSFDARRWINNVAKIEMIIQ